MNALEITSLTKRYGASVALDKVNIYLPEGEIYGLLGANGAGKTSLLRIIAELQTADEGELQWGGHPSKSRERVSQVGYLPEERGLYPRMSVSSQLEYIGRLHGLNREEAQKEIRKWIERFELSAILPVRPEKLSKGQAQLVQFIAAVLHQPGLLVLDEPFSGFDLINTASVVQEIQALRDGGTTILLATHRLNWAAELCSRATLLHQGRVLAQGAMNELLEEPSGIYEASLEEKVPDPLLPEGCSLRQIHYSDSRTQLEVQLNAEMKAEQLLNHLGQHYALSSFQAKRETLHDLFLRKVTAL